MRKKLDTRFPAARIKKIMQADEDVGKIAMAVPVLVSKALELFLQDLCDRTYEITLKRGAKTLNSMHLKQCIQSFSVFDFLREIVSKVPEFSGSDAAAVADDRSVTKRRKVADDDDNYSDDESNLNRMHESAHTSNGGRGSRDRGRGRGRGRGNKTLEREAVAHYEKFEDNQTVDNQNDKHLAMIKKLDNSCGPEDPKEDIAASQNHQTPVHDFDLNVGLDENKGGYNPVLPDAAQASLSEPIFIDNHEELPGWSLADVEKMDIDPFQLAILNQRSDEYEEDYDDEG